MITSLPKPFGNFRMVSTHSYIICYRGEADPLRLQLAQKPYQGTPAVRTTEYGPELLWDITGDKLIKFVKRVSSQVIRKHIVTELYFDICK